MTTSTSNSCGFYGGNIGHMEASESNINNVAPSVSMIIREIVVCALLCLRSKSKNKGPITLANFSFCPGPRNQKLVLSLHLKFHIFFIILSNFSICTKKNSILIKD
ncbi:hypothetical protein QVD17_07829 [Tagetes erecta]|uniref:Uncharacterized protein n=1 Tax=Tagetes erecta TaxID=13708 RepID=A0AAD8P489_TARER|nr:hypothetical protein QVD17_07829 [Tagetes erecta]